MREIVNAQFYILRAGCQWRMLPNDLPNRSTVYHYFNEWRSDGTWQKTNDELRCQVRVAEGRNKDPSAAIVDSQSVKTTDVGGIVGFDAGKKVKGRKRHILVDTLGLLLAVVVHSAGIQDRDGAKLLLSKGSKMFPSIKLIWADGGYAGRLLSWVLLHCNVVLEIVKRHVTTPGFHLLKRRWVVERTFAWLGKYRRLAKEYEYFTDTSETMIYAALSHLMLRRLAPYNTS